jgi:uncharacterized protein YvpB
MHRGHLRHIGIFLLVIAGIGLLTLGGLLLSGHRIIDIEFMTLRAVGIVSASLSPDPPATVMLPVPFHRQEHALSCEAAALLMALRRYGVSVTESEIIRALPFDRTPKRTGVWGDPNAGFVGNIDGRMLRDGYGVYWDPIADVGRRWKPTSVLRDGTAQDVARHLAAGRPVVMWGALSPVAGVTWRTPAGKHIHAVNGEHARVVTGFSGSVQNPRGFFLLDPIYGKLYWSTAKFLQNWGVLGRSGVVVYP